MHHYSEVLGEFTLTHPLPVDRGQEVFDGQVLQWHNDLLTLQVLQYYSISQPELLVSLQAAIHGDFDVIWSEASNFDICSTVLYIVTIHFSLPLSLSQCLPCRAE